MSKRTERREAERLVRKEAYKQLRQERAQQPAAVVAEPKTAEAPTAVPQEDLLARAHAFFQTEERASQAVLGFSGAAIAKAAPPPLLVPEPPRGALPAFTEEQPPTISDAQLAANRANAQLSSGPKSSTGKAKSSMNALKHGLTSQTVVLAGEDLAEYNAKLEYSIDRCQPVGDEELRLVQSIVDSTWRINRILRLESSVFLKGYTEFENKFDDRPPTERKGFIQAEVYLKYEKSFRNLCTQEARLRRCREKDQAELTRLQTMRKREERIAAEAEQAVSKPVRPSLATQAPGKNGFVFSTPQISPEQPPSEAA